MKAAYLHLKAIWKNIDGATAIEYALIASAVGLTIAATMPVLASNMDSTYSTIVDYFNY